MHIYSRIYHKIGPSGFTQQVLNCGRVVGSVSIFRVPWPGAGKGAEQSPAILRGTSYDSDTTLATPATLRKVPEPKTAQPKL